MQLIARHPSALRERCAGCGKAPPLSESSELWSQILTDSAQRVCNFCGTCSTQFARWYSAQRSPALFVARPFGQRKVQR
jgi:hypothetical protein